LLHREALPALEIGEVGETGDAGHVCSARKGVVGVNGVDVEREHGEACVAFFRAVVRDAVVALELFEQAEHPRGGVHGGQRGSTRHEEAEQYVEPHERSVSTFSCVWDH
jgi:hypothetical protein